MIIKDILLAPRYGIYRPGTGTVDFELTSYGRGFKLSTSMEVLQGTYEEVGIKIKNYIDKAKIYTSDQDLALLGYLVKGLEVGSTHIIKFDHRGITLASLITVDARKVQFIYEKYSDQEYALQLSLTRESSLSFAWSDSKLTGDFYFNIKRSGDEDVTSITGYTKFHLGNADAAMPVVISAGVVKRKSLPKPKDPTKAQESDTKKELQKVNHTYIRLQSRSAKGLTVKDIISMFVKLSKDNENDIIPDVLDKVTFHDFAILTKSDKNTETKEFAVVIDCMIAIKDTPLRSKLTIHTETTGTGENKKHSFTFTAVVTVDVHQFQLRFDKSSSGTGDNNKSSWSILASYAHSGTVTLDIQKMLKTLFGDSDSLPPLSIDLKKPKVFFIYQRAKTTDGDNTETKGKFLFGAGASIDLSVKELPIAGSVLVEMKAMAFEEVMFIYSSDQLSKEDIRPLVDAKMLDKKFEPRKGLSLSAGVVIDGKKEFYTFGGEVKDPKKEIDPKDPDPKDPQPKKDDPAPLNEVKVTQELPADASSDAKWYIIDKQLGPVNLQRLGLKYQDGRAYIMLDASIKTSSFSLQAMGLGLGFKPDWNDMQPSFHLRGLGLSYKTDTVEISGAFLRGQQQLIIDGKTLTIDTYNGAAMIKMKKFSISAIGSYAEYMEQEQKKTSLFVYGVFLGNIGGPPIFYVTGIAAGFGYNRKINAPEITDLADYPLVALAMSGENKSLGDVLSSLETPMSNGKLPIDISPGNYWLALGVKFTSFKIIESFVLVTVNFGLKTEFNILGLSRMDWPEKSLRSKLGIGPIVYLELAIKVSFGSDSDVIKVDGLITPNSYVLSQDCRLFGGFAFYTWISGEHAGDFVLSIGGYHPRFSKPAHYPEVPRVGLVWKMGESLTLRGELYFALTPSAIMMGGRWELHFVTKIIKASFAIWIDLLIQWAPFYYDIGIGILIDIEAHIPLKLVTIHLNIHFRAELQIWGPSFSGIAEVDLGIYSFSIGFGSAKRGNPEPLEWNAFANGFLPKAKAQEAPRAIADSGLDAAEGDALPQVDAIQIILSDGVIQTIEEKGKEKLYIANPMQMAVSIDSTIPVTRISLHEDKKEIAVSTPESKANLGVKPCGFHGTDMEYSMHIAIKKGREEVKNNIKVEERTKGFPTALWSTPKEKDTVDGDNAMILSGIMSGVVITTTEPKQYPEDPRTYDFSKLVVNMTKPGIDIRIATLGPKVGFIIAKVYDTLTKTYDVSASHRKALLDDIRHQFEGYLDDDFADEFGCASIYSAPKTYFRAEPKIASIGAHKHNPTDTKNT